MRYHLIHITTGGEFKTPLVASQLFDQAECQSLVEGDNKPETVSAWVIEPMREYWNKNSISKINALRMRCPHIDIKLIGGISRLGLFPSKIIMVINRLLLGKGTAVYHCRGEAALRKVLFLKKYFTHDKIVLDVRGHWPSELLYTYGVTDIKSIPPDLKSIYLTEEENLKAAIQKADAVTTVTGNLRNILKEEYGAPDTTTVVPCCIKNITNIEHRSEIRKELGFTYENKVVVYSGTTAAYQHLEDLTLPFLNHLLANDENVRVLLLTPDITEMRRLVMKINIPEKRVVIRSVDQVQVGKYLTAADIGVLIRKASLVNKVAQPVKIAEYMGAGLKLIVESDSVGIPAELLKNKLALEVHTTQHIDEEILKRDIFNVLNTLNSSSVDVHEVQGYASKYFLWQNAILIHRNTYSRLVN